VQPCPLVQRAPARAARVHSCSARPLVQPVRGLHEEVPICTSHAVVMRRDSRQVPPAGLLLAAGAGRRMGRPKALVEVDGEPLVRRALAVLTGGGAAPVVVVLGAEADAVRALLPPDAGAVEAPDWADGMGASLRAGLAALEAVDGPQATVVHLVDLPGVPAAAVARLAAAGDDADVLARAAYGGRPGHPVLIGRAHWREVRAAALGDVGARGYLAGRLDVRLVECGDLADPDDVDTPKQLEAFRLRRRP
jgi:CTP:molybdopterin cytidylyltransferase MocA